MGREININEVWDMCGIGGSPVLSLGVIESMAPDYVLLWMEDGGRTLTLRVGQQQLAALSKAVDLLKKQSSALSTEEANHEQAQ